MDEKKKRTQVDPAVVEKARSGDLEAFGALYETVYKDMYRLALYILKDPQDAEDAVAEAVADAYSSIGNLREPEAFRGWIFRILSIKCKRLLKGFSDAPVSLDENPEAGENLPASDHEPSMAEAAAVREIFYHLDDTDRCIIAMSVFGGYTSLEIAGYLGMNAATVRSRQMRALSSMRKQLS